MTHAPCHLRFPKYDELLRELIRLVCKNRQLPVCDALVEAAKFNTRETTNDPSYIDALELTFERYQRWISA